jgi:acetolactate synthase-1/2/3 large subunit
MKVSDYIIQQIEALGVKHVFFLPGGGAMHMNDSLGQSTKLQSICMLHEQAAAIAAEAYSRISENIGVCMTTSGPGATNAITGLAGAWLDSTPVLFLSGQVKSSDLVGTQEIRQFGIQEVDIISIVKPITKYAVQIKEPNDIRYEMEKAIASAKHGRPGPVWIDIPLDIQASIIEPTALRLFDSSSMEGFQCTIEDVESTIHLLNQARRPVLIIGNGIRLAGASYLVRSMVETLGVPVLTTWNGIDLIEDSHPLYFGRPGAVGQRYANFIQQKADFVLSIGTRLNLLSTGFDYDSFLKNAVHVMVDIDRNEMRKKSVHPNLAICCDAKSFIDSLMERKSTIDEADRTEWLEVCKMLKKKFPVSAEITDPEDGKISTYELVDCLTNLMADDDIYQFSSSGTSVDIAMQVFQIKRGQRAFLTKGLASMGFDIPASIGSCLASGGRRTVCVTGDGGFVMNVQELETLRRLNLPIKIFVIDNSGYSMIYSSQRSNFDGCLNGCTVESGLSLPSVNKLADAFGIPSYSISQRCDMEHVIHDVLCHPGPVLCRVEGSIAQPILPRQTNYMKTDGQMASRPLEEMSPLLDPDELSRIMQL